MAIEEDPFIRSALLGIHHISEELKKLSTFFNTQQEPQTQEDAYEIQRVTNAMKHRLLRISDLAARLKHDLELLREEKKPRSPENPHI